MPDLKQALKDFVATSNSGKYTDEATLLSKFPELKGYDVQALRDFVATSNSGKYATEEEVFSKFPEFNVQGELVKKDYKGLMGISADIELKKKRTNYTIGATIGYSTANNSTKSYGFAFGRFFFGFTKTTTDI